MKRYLVIISLIALFLISTFTLTCCKQIYTTSEAKLFYVGEGANENNNFTPRTQSFFDKDWLINYGGVDFPERRIGNNPEDFIPKLNPYYVGLPKSVVNEDNKDEYYDKFVEVKYSNKKCKAEVKDRSYDEAILISPALRDCLGFVNGSVEWRSYN